MDSILLINKTNGKQRLKLNNNNKNPTCSLILVLAITGLVRALPRGGGLAQVATVCDGVRETWMRIPVR